ncbi:hypothetical protein F0U62_31345 [Cystobacter fuscus]|uniref:hypothetical protein n=1 Tax=Cystobacter fuscus TaxID=43 RepID=UPI002B2CEE65|nr:hypothetical protein F0U62_31345 [Cystobacter fuscus]
MKHIKVALVGAMAAALLLHPGCRADHYKSSTPQKQGQQQGTGGSGGTSQQQGTGGSGANSGTMGHDNQPKPEGSSRGGTRGGTGGGGTGVGSTDTGDVQGSGTPTPGTGTQGSGGATNTGQNQGDTSR